MHRYSVLKKSSQHAGGKRAVNHLHEVLDDGGRRSVGRQYEFVCQIGAFSSSPSLPPRRRLLSSPAPSLSLSASSTRPPPPAPARLCLSCVDSACSFVLSVSSFARSVGDAQTAFRLSWRRLPPPSLPPSFPPGLPSSLAAFPASFSICSVRFLSRQIYCGVEH